MSEDTVTRAYLTDVIHQKFGYSRAESADFIDAILEEINQSLVNESEVKISSFGTFKVRQKKPRIGRNPKTKEEIPISARNVVSFYVSNILKNRINEE